MKLLIRVCVTLFVHAAMVSPLAANTPVAAIPTAADRLSSPMKITCKGLIPWPWCPQGK